MDNQHRFLVKWKEIQSQMKNQMHNIMLSHRVVSIAFDFMFDLLSYCGWPKKFSSYPWFVDLLFCNDYMCTIVFYNIMPSGIVNIIEHFCNRNDAMWYNRK